MLVGAGIESVLVKSNPPGWPPIICASCYLCIRVAHSSKQFCSVFSRFWSDMTNHGAHGGVELPSAVPGCQDIAERKDLKPCLALQPLRLLPHHG